MQRPSRTNTKQSNKKTNMSTKIAPVSPKTKLYTKSADEHITYEEYVTENSKAHNLPAEMVSKIGRTVKSGEDFEIPDDTPSKQAKAAKAFIIQCKADMKAHTKNKKTVEANDAQAKLAREKEKADAKEATEKELKESSAMMEKSLGSNS